MKYTEKCMKHQDYHSHLIKVAVYLIPSNINSNRILLLRSETAIRVGMYFQNGMPRPAQDEELGAGKAKYFPRIPGTLVLQYPLLQQSSPLG
jgi:hypothetical protein